MRKPFLCLIGLPLLLSGCVAAALGVGAGVLISQDVLDSNTYVARLDVGVERVWTTVKTTLSYSSLKPIDVDNELRVANAEIDGARVTVAVETYDLDRSLVRVAAKKYNVANGEIAKMVLDKILVELER